MSNSSFLSEERAPLPATLLKTGIILSGLVPLLLVMKSGTQPYILGYAAFAVAAVLAFVGWNNSLSNPTRNEPGAFWNILLIAAGLVAGSGLFLQKAFSISGLLFCILMPVLTIIHAGLSSDARFAKHILLPLLFGSIFMFSAAALGDVAAGAFPAIVGALFVAVVRATFDIEEDFFENHADKKHFEVEHHYRTRLALTAVIFFLFGTVSLWPWLGEMYGSGYFYLLLFGVLIPLAFFWGRIRQPKMEGARTALIRFNRIAPILGLIYILALVVS
jgi:hypothetical protein